MTSRNEWTLERTGALCEMWKAGLSAFMIAKALGVTRNAVIGKAWRMGMGCSRAGKMDSSEIRERISEGLRRAWAEGKFAERQGFVTKYWQSA